MPSLPSTRRLPLVAILASLGCLIAPPLTAQQPRFGAKIDVRLVNVDVIVTRGDGTRVYGLTAKDFEVFEGRTRQAITNFAEYRPAPSQADVPLEEASPTTSTVLTPRTPHEPHTLLVLIDSLPRTGFVRTRVFEHLETLLTKMMHDGDRAGVIFWEPGYERARTIIDPTSDTVAVREALRNLAGKKTIESENASAEGHLFDTIEKSASPNSKIDVAREKLSSDFFSADADLLRLRRKTAAIARLVESLAGLGGRKTILYVSNDFPLPVFSPQGDETQHQVGLAMIKVATDAANAHGVTFYAVHPALPDDHLNASDRIGVSTTYFQRFGREQRVVSEKSDSARNTFEGGMEGLESLTVPTGGLVDFGLRSVEDLGKQIDADSQSYYSIGYQAASDGRDHKRKVEVKTRDRSYHVRTRESILEKSNETAARDTLLARLFSGEGGDDLHFTIEEGAVKRAGRDRWLLPVVVKIPAGQLQFTTEGPRRIAHLKILIISATALAEVTPRTETDLGVVAGENDRDGFVRYSVEILGDKRGSKVSIGVLDRRSGLVGVRTIDNRARF